MTRAAGGTLDVPALLDAAIRLLTRSGLPGFTLERLADEAAVAVDDVRGRFADTATVLRELVIRGMRDVSERVASVVSAAPDGSAAVALYVDTYVHHFLERFDEFRVVFLLRQTSGNFGIDEEVMRRSIYPLVNHPIGLVNDKLTADHAGQELPGGIHPRRLAFSGHLLSIGLLSTLGVALAAGSNLLHTSDDMIREAGRALGAPIAALRQLSALNEVAVELGRARTETRLLAEVPALLGKVLAVEEAFFALRGPLVDGLPAEAARALEDERSVYRQGGADDASVIATPVRYEGQVEGVLGGVWRGSRQEIDRGHVARIETFAAMVGLALENVRLYENLMAQVETRSRSLQQAHVRLAEAEKMATLGKLVAAVLHEINTPVAAALSAQETLAKTVERLGQRAPDEPEADKLRRIAGQSGQLIATGLRRVSDVVQQLKRFSRLDAADTERIDLNEAVSDTLAMLQHELPAGCRIDSALGELPPVSCQPGRISHALLQVVRNAMEALGEGGTVRVRSSAPRADQVCIVVEDDGAGIAAGDLPRVFEPGFSTKGSRVRAGLGLATAYQVVRDHGGEIRVDSEPGRGTRVTIELPTERPAA